VNREEGEEEKAGDWLCCGRQMQLVRRAGAGVVRFRWRSRAVASFLRLLLFC
jgi:hypothetical protein